MAFWQTSQPELFGPLKFQSIPYEHENLGKLLVLKRRCVRNLHNTCFYNLYMVHISEVVWNLSASTYIFIYLATQPAGTKYFKQKFV